jgi:hypothetical protein
MHRELDAEFAVVSEQGFRTPVANIARVTAILECSNNRNLRQALHYAQRAWLTVERRAAILDINEAITTTMLVEVRPLARGSSHLQEATRNNLIIPTIGILKTYPLKTCARKSMKNAMRDP